jgi:hypothetical protein
VGLGKQKLKKKTGREKKKNTLKRKRRGVETFGRGARVCVKAIYSPSSDPSPLVLNKKTVWRGVLVVFQSVGERETRERGRERRTRERE